MKTRIPAAVLLSCLVRAAAQVPALPPDAPAPPVPPAGTADPRSRALLPDDPAPLLDLTLEEAWKRLGPPRRILAVRGNEPWQDDVVFEYGDGLSVYWYRDRLWQIRLSAGYGGSCFGFFLGDPADKALSLLGTPDRGESGILEWRLPWRGYPAKLRLVTRDGAITEAYVYRSDF
jgi:hypothetical protein